MQITISWNDKQPLASNHKILDWNCKLIIGNIIPFSISTLCAWITLKRFIDMAEARSGWWPEDTGELALIMRKGDKNKEVRASLWSRSPRSPFFAIGSVLSKAKANLIKIRGMGWVQLVFGPVLYHCRSRRWDQCSRGRDSSLGAGL